MTPNEKGLLLWLIKNSETQGWSLGTLADTFLYGTLTFDTLESLINQGLIRKNVIRGVTHYFPTSLGTVTYQPLTQDEFCRFMLDNEHLDVESRLDSKDAFLLCDPIDLKELLKNGLLDGQSRWNMGDMDTAIPHFLWLTEQGINLSETI